MASSVIDALSRFDHKIFVKLIGYCEENEPFQQDDVKEMEHLDWTARVGEIASLEGISKLKSSGDGESQNSELPPIVDPEVNVHSYGILLIEIISGKLPYSAEHGAIEKWVCLGCLVNL
ncbi:hypothetical protein J1N35_031144 [Gossypium stocksii]|uniref:Serine-threonine/tyrosine-protein kinase catalytic domain-containing protein n=1 Tax=Gossypium stocksii TaxID=47602 RepID=A0A9D3ZUT0_9ROSI|nr:hypothetical protein J1N35_031144 [Gossypium stocksii]